MPQAGKPTFEIQDDEIEIGMGIHGEVGIEVRKMMTAQEIVTVLLDKITEDMPIAEGDEVAVLVNGLRGTPMDELYICYKSLGEYFDKLNTKIVSKYIGEYATSMEMSYNFV